MLYKPQRRQYLSPNFWKRTNIICTAHPSYRANYRILDEVKQRELLMKISEAFLVTKREWTLTNSLEKYKREDFLFLRSLLNGQQQRC